MKQKDIFLQSEGDAYFARNHQALAGCWLPGGDALLKEMLGLFQKSAGGGDSRLRVLEVGCGDGTRLAWLKDSLDAGCYGVAIGELACSKKIVMQQGSADALPFDSQSFDC